MQITTKLTESRVKATKKEIRYILDECLRYIGNQLKDVDIDLACTNKKKSKSWVDIKSQLLYAIAFISWFVFSYCI